jgi:hypothetical protein
MLNAMRWLVEDACPDDALFIHCEWVDVQKRHSVKSAADSGHGGQTRDVDGDEVDGWDDGNSIQSLTFLTGLKKTLSYFSS